MTDETLRPIRVVIADDEVMVRGFIAGKLTHADGIEVVAEAGNGREAVEAARAYAPDVLLMDVRMPELDGIRATREVARLAPDVRIVAMTGLAVDEYVGSMVEAGALGFLPKVRVADEIEQTIRIAAAGESFVGPRAEVTRMIAEAASVAADDEQAEARRLYERLSPRESEVAQQMARGLKLPEIADLLGIGVTTVRSHQGEVLAKLGANNRTIAAQIIAKAGFGPDLFLGRQSRA